MVSRYKKRSQTRLCDGETRLVPGSENESTDILFEKTRRERVRTLLLLLFYEAHVRVLLRVFPFERRRDFKEEEERRKDARSARTEKEDHLSLSLFAEKPKALLCIPSCQNAFERSRR